MKMGIAPILILPVLCGCRERSFNTSTPESIYYDAQGKNEAILFSSKLPSWEKREYEFRILLENDMTSMERAARKLGFNRVSRYAEVDKRTFLEKLGTHLQRINEYVGHRGSIFFFNASHGYDPASSAELGGAFCYADEYITTRDLADLIRARIRPDAPLQRLFWFSMSCHSGAWVDFFRAAYSPNPPPEAAGIRERILSAVVVASSTAAEATNVRLYEGQYGDFFNTALSAMNDDPQKRNRYTVRNFTDHIAFVQRDVMTGLFQKYGMRERVGQMDAYIFPESLGNEPLFLPTSRANTVVADVRESLVRVFGRRSAPPVGMAPAGEGGGRSDGLVVQATQGFSQLESCLVNGVVREFPFLFFARKDDASKTLVLETRAPQRATVLETVLEAVKRSCGAFVDTAYIVSASVNPAAAPALPAPMPAQAVKALAVRATGGKIYKAYSCVSRFASPFGVELSPADMGQGNFQVLLNGKIPAPEDFRAQLLEACGPSLVAGVDLVR